MKVGTMIAEAGGFVSAPIFSSVSGTVAKIDNAIDALKKGKIKVFSGNHIGVNPLNPADTIDLSQGYTEHQNSSNPSFGYILKDCIILEN